jgi:hypothetical protein
MHLRLARLCLDCEEIHDAQQCPACASETFAFLTRWVPTPDRRAQPRPIEPPRAPSRKAVIGYGVLGLGIMAAARWLASGKKRLEDSALKKNVGELR